MIKIRNLRYHSGASSEEVAKVEQAAGTKFSAIERREVRSFAILGLPPKKIQQQISQSNACHNSNLTVKKIKIMKRSVVKGAFSALMKGVAGAAGDDFARVYQWCKLVKEGKMKGMKATPPCLQPRSFCCAFARAFAWLPGLSFHFFLFVLYIYYLEGVVDQWLF